MTRSGPKLLSPVADRDLLVFAALLVLAAVAMVVNVLLVLAAGIAAALLGAPVQLTPADGWIATGVRILADADDPGRHLGPPWGPALAGHPVVYWVVATVLLGLAAAAATPVVGLGWRRWGPTPAGHASRREIRRELSLPAARATARWTRPGLSDRDRARAPLDRGGRPAAPRPDRPHVLTADQPDRHPRPDPDRQIPRRPRAQGAGRPRRAAVQHHQTRPARVRRARPHPPPPRRPGPGVRRHRHHQLARPAALVAHLRLPRPAHRLPARPHHGRGRRGAPHRGQLGQRPGLPRARHHGHRRLPAGRRAARPRGGCAGAVGHRQAPLHRTGGPARTALPAAGPQPARGDHHGGPDRRRGVAVGAPGHRAAARPQPGRPVLPAARPRASTPPATSPKAAACSSSPDNTRPRTPCRSSPRWPNTG